MKQVFFLTTFITFSIFSKAITVYKDVAPILIVNCNSCHHNGGIGSDYTKYYQVFATGSLIKNYVQNNVMPPWPADSSYRHYVHERIVSAADKATLINWIDAGMPAGDTTLAPPLPAYGNTQLYGTPDLILNVPKFTSTATNSDHYYCINVPTGLSQNRYIRAFEFVPGNAALIHHAVITIDTFGTATDDMSGSCFNFQGQVNIGDYAPGMGPTVLPGVSPTKFGFMLKAGSKISFQIHVPEGSAGEKDSSQLRIYFYPIAETGVRDMYFYTALQNWSFTVPPNTVTTTTAKYPTGSAGIPVALSLYGAFPHSHKTCTAITNLAYNGTDTIPLIRINNWDFHWQMQYTFKNLIKMPQNYHLFSKHIFDNTSANPNTPDHNQMVVAGTNTYDEMLFDSYLYAIYQNGDELVDIEALLMNDPLFYPTNTVDVSKTISSATAYPNPFTDETKIEYTLTSAQYVKVSIYNQLGQEVRKISSGIEASGTHAHVWDARDAGGNRLPTGMYVYKIQVGLKSLSGKIMLK